MQQRAIPLIQLRDFLIASIQVELTDEHVLALKDSVAAEISARPVRGLVIEISGIDVFDSFIAASIRQIAQVARLMGVHTVVAGLDAAMAITLVEMGMTMQGVHTAPNLDAAVDLLEEEVRRDRTDDAELTAMLLAGSGGERSVGS